MATNTNAFEEKLALIKQNLQEVLGEDTIVDILRQRDLCIYWGTATTGRPHIAYFLPMVKLADFLHAGCHVTVLFADLHAYLDNMKAPWELLAHRTRYYELVIKELLETIGVPLDKLRFIRGSDFQLTREYILDVFRLSTICSEHDAKKAGADVVKQVENAMLSGLIYPGMQALDEHYLGVDAQFGGVDQRRIFVFAEKYMPQLGYAKCAHLMNPMVAGLTGAKMSSSEPDTKVDLLDDPATVTRKIQKAFCEEGNIERNGILPFVKNVLFPVLKARPIGVSARRTFVIERPEKYGGNVEFASYGSLESAFADRSIHPGDLKAATSKYINLLLHPIRRKFSEPENARLVMDAYPEDGAKLEVIRQALEKIQFKEEEPKNDMSRFDLRVGRIISARKHPEADKLYIEEIDVGEYSPRTILSGIAAHYAPEELVGRLVVVFCNLKPAVMRGIASHGMIAAANDETRVELVEPPKDSQPGEAVFAPGFEYAGTGDALLDGRKKDKKLFEETLAEWRTDEQCVACYRKVSMQTARGGLCAVPSLSNAPIR